MAPVGKTPEVDYHISIEAFINGLANDLVLLKNLFLWQNKLFSFAKEMISLAKQVIY